MATPQGSIPLPERNSSYVRVVYARVGFPVCCTSLSSRVVGRFMHFGDKHSHPCIRDLTQCPWCEIRLRKLWYGWLYGIDQIKRGPALIQLTETAVRGSTQLSDGGIDLRGAKIELQRLTDGKGSTVRAAVSLNTWADRNHDKEEPNVLQHLLRFYKLDVERLLGRVDGQVPS